MSTSSGTLRWDNIGLKAGFLTCAEAAPDGVHDEMNAHWCEHIKKFIDDGEDAILYHPGTILNVPVLPRKDVWTTVEISDETIGQSAMMKMRYTPDVGKERVVPLGIWNPGEGARSIRGVIVDFIKSRIDPRDATTLTSDGPVFTKCPNRAHGLQEMRLLAQHMNASVKWKCLWDIAMEGACTPCINFAAGVSNDNFGLDGIDTKPDWAKQ